MNEFKWIDLYTELANVLLTYKNDRLSLIDRIKEVYNTIGIKLPTLEKDNNIVDIDPFTIFALFNKGISNSNRIKILNGFKSVFSLVAEVPDEFDGIPVVNPMKATFYNFIGERKEDDIENLWRLLEVALSFADEGRDEEVFTNCFDRVIKQKGVSWNITMGLYWVRPYTYINLDARNRKLLENNYERFAHKFDIVKLLKFVPSGKEYLNIITSAKDIMTEYKTFPELSYDAWKQSTEDKIKFYGEEIKYWPSLEEYNPNLTKDDWKMFILEVERPKHPRPMQMLKALVDIGGEATCKKLSEVYGGTVSAYVGYAVNLGKRAKNFFNLPPCMDGNQERFFPIPFLGRNVKNDNKEENYSYCIRPELFKALKEIDLSDVSLYYDEKSDDMVKSNIEKNLILYGPPGTGKTYNTVNYAVAIIENKALEKVSSEEYDDVLKRYNNYKKEGKIELTTFHQSYGYEEFIEGIKPVVSDKSDESTDIVYDVVPGVFKAFCDKMELKTITNSAKDYYMNENPSIWKVSLEGTGDNLTRKECLEKGHIRIGWDSYGENITDETDYSNYGGKNPLNAFINRMRIGDIVLSCYSATTIDAIGVVTGEYEWHDEYPHYKRLRKVNWLVKNINEDIMGITQGTTMTLSSVYRLSMIAVKDVLRIVDKYNTSETDISENGNYVFIIDEINRGNISKVLGELITLIEPTKRKGQPEEMQVKLPYSQTEFGVPDNVYIIGTMNTADRSIAAIDTALRRRFSFKEMLPDADVLAGINVEGISVSNMLDKMNKRIEVLYDREHTIGHAYFMPLKNDSSMETLAEIFKNKIIPLLQEYFYEDYEKIRLVLGDNQKNEEPVFIIKEDVKEIDLFGEDTDIIEEASKYSINEDAFGDIDAYKKMI